MLRYNSCLVLEYFAIYKGEWGNGKETPVRVWPRGETQGRADPAPDLSSMGPWVCFLTRPGLRFPSCEVELSAGPALGGPRAREMGLVMHLSY